MREAAERLEFLLDYAILTGTLGRFGSHLLCSGNFLCINSLLL